MEKCHYCPKPSETIDHIVPRALGGPDVRWNCVPSCEKCNQEKSDQIPSCRCETCAFAIKAFAWIYGRNVTVPQETPVTEYIPLVPAPATAKIPRLSETAIEDVREEFLRAVAKHGFANTPAHPMMADTARLIVLVEEIGEVARAMTYDEGSLTQLRKELIQVAAMCIAWVTGMEE